MASVTASSGEWMAAGGRAEAKAIYELTGRTVYLEHRYTPKSETESRLVGSGRYHVKRVRMTEIGGTPYLVLDTSNDKERLLLKYEANEHPEFSFVDGPIGKRALRFRVRRAGTIMTSVAIVG